MLWICTFIPIFQMRQLRQGEVEGGQVTVGGHLPSSEGTPGRVKGMMVCVLLGPDRAPSGPLLPFTATKEAQGHL